MAEGPNPIGNTIGVVLAAGGSSRLGQPKQLLDINGQPMITHVVDALAAVAGIDRIIVVLGAHAESIRSTLAGKDVVLVENPRWAEGQSTSLHAALDALRGFPQPVHRLLITLCDQPRISTQAFQHLVKALDESTQSVAASSYEGHLGAPCLFAILTPCDGSTVIGARDNFSVTWPATKSSR